jgi:hypothetical protein
VYEECPSGGIWSTDFTKFICHGNTFLEASPGSIEKGEYINMEKKITRHLLMNTNR